MSQTQSVANPDAAPLKARLLAAQKRRDKDSLRYSEDQPRDPDGRFGSGGGASDTSSGTLPPASPQDLQTAVGRWDNNFEDVFKVRSAADQIVTGQAVTKEGFHATEATRAAAETDARALISGVEHGDPSTETLYRGMTIPAEDVGRYQEGQPVAFSLGSFSSDPDIATYATNPRFNNFQGNEGVPVYYELAPGARNVDFEKAAGIARDSEHITGGTFQVTHIEPWQKPDIFPGPNGIKVSLQQMEPPKVGMAIRSRSRRVRLEDLDPYLSGTMPKVRVRALQRRRLRRDELRYSEDQPRDPDGRFGSGGGSESTKTSGGGPSPAAIDARIAGLTTIKASVGGTFQGQHEVNAGRGTYSGGGSRLATEYYVSSDGEHEIDGALRHGGSEESVRIAQGYAKDIEASMGTSRVDSVAYRGIVTPPGQEYKPGDSFTDKGLVSLSSDKGIATAFAEGRSTGTIDFTHVKGLEDTIEVEVPRVAGTPTTLAVEVPKGSMGRTGELDIYETILPRDTTFHVIGTGSDGTVLVRAQEVGMP